MAINIPREKYLDIVCREPYRLLFPAGAFASFFGLGVWAVYWLFPHRGYPLGPHVNIQIKVVLLCFIYGFLYTLLPKLLHWRPLSRFQIGYLTTSFLLIFIFSLSPSSAANTAVNWISLGIPLQFLGFFGSRRKETAAPYPLEFHFLHVAFIFHVPSSLIIIAASHHFPVPAIWVLAAHRFLTQGFVLLIILGMGSFLIPKLLLTPDRVPGYLQSNAGRKNKSPVPIWMVGSLFALSFVLDLLPMPFDLGLRLASSVRFLVFTTIMVNRFAAGPWPGHGPWNLKFAWIALWSIPFSFLCTLVWPVEKISWDHIIYVDGFILLILSIASKTMAGHAGDTGILKKYPRWTVTSGSLILLGMSTRVSCFFVKSYNMHLGVSALCVLGGIAIWMVIFLPKTAQISGYPPQSRKIA